MAGGGVVAAQSTNQPTNQPAECNLSLSTPKVIGSALAVASSLVMGKEGPMLHAGSILAVILGA
jgi:H+/Cl- antiporter ClcA